MQSNQSNLFKKFFNVISWTIFAVIFLGLIAYMTIHVQDLLDSDMSSEMILAKQLSTSCKILSDNWYYSTEIRILNTQLFYSLFFRFFTDWQLVRILGNITLYLFLLASYYFFCKRFKIERFFPITAGMMLLPLSSPYFYILLYGAYYIPRISMMFILLGILLPANQNIASKFMRIFFFLVIGVLSFALGLEGPRMILILFIPLVGLICLEAIFSLFLSNSRTRKNIQTRFQDLIHSDFLYFFVKSATACSFALTGYLINSAVLSEAYHFEHVDLSLQFSLSNIKSTLLNQIHVFGFGRFTYILSLSIWVIIGILCITYLLQKNLKLQVKRYVLFCFVVWSCYTVFCFAFPIGLVSWHFVPIAVLFIPCFVIVVKDINMKTFFKQMLCSFVCASIFFIALLGYSSFKKLINRDKIRNNAEFMQIASVLEKNQFYNGYATFWNANILTELSDGKIDVWSLNEFDANTTTAPDIFQWLQLKSHDSEFPQEKVFMIWTTKEYLDYQTKHFNYVGKEIYRSDAFVVFEVLQ